MGGIVLKTVISTVIEFLERPHRLVGTTFTLAMVLVLSLGAYTPVHALDSSFLGLQELRDYRTAIGLLKSEDYRLARTQYRKFLKQYPDSDRRPGAYFGLAETYYLTDRYDSAASNYLRSLRSGDLASEYVQPALKRGLHSVLESGRIDLAEGYIEAVQRESDVVDEEIDRRYVRVLRASGRTEEALEKAREWYQDHPDSPFWRYQMGLLSASKKNHDRAVELFEPLTEGDTEYRDRARFNLAEALYEQGKYDRAAEFYRLVQNDSPFESRAEYGLAWVSIKKRNMKKARKLLRNVAENGRSDRANAARDLARIYRSESKVEKSDRWYARAIQEYADPKKSELRIEYANYLVNRGDLTGAIPLYESAKALEFEARKNLIRAYMVDGQFERAEEMIQEQQSTGKLQDPAWRLRLARARFHQGSYEDALDALPDPENSHDTGLRQGILTLKGGLYYRLERWEDARRVFEQVSRAHSPWEARYYEALLSEKLEDSSRARELLGTLEEENPPEPWASRVAYQRARLAFEEGSPDRYESHVSSVDRDQLSPALIFELDLLRYAHSLREDPRGESRQRARELKKEAEKFGQLDNWYGYLSAAENLPLSWWEDLLVPTLQSNEPLRRDWGSRTVRILRNRGHGELAVRVGVELVERLPAGPERRRVRSELLTVLRSQNRYQELGSYLPDREDWGKWGSSLHRSLGLALAEYHLETENFREGLEALREFEETFREKSRTLENELAEWKAALEIKLGEYESARERLVRIASGDRSTSGTLNLSVTEFHLGDTRASFRRLRDLYRNDASHSLTLYDYGFRYLRSAERYEELKDWTDSLLQNHEPTGEPVRDLLLVNVRSWVNNDRSTTALEVIDRVLTRFETRSEGVPFEFYRALAHYNAGDLDRSLEELGNLRDRVDRESEWSRRIIDLTIENYVRQGRWSDAYETWWDLHEHGKAGPMGQRLLVSRGLQAAPDSFEKVLQALEEHYPGHLVAEDRVYWTGRLAEYRGRDDRAVDRYDEYLSRGWPNRRSLVARRLAELHRKRDNHARALDLFQKLNEWNDDPIYELRQASALRELGRHEEAQNLLETVLSDHPNLRSRAHYELAYVHLARDRNQAARKQFQEVVSGTSSDSGWVRDARDHYVGLSLAAGDTKAANRGIERMKEGPRRSLHEVEYQRQQGNLKRAQSLLGNLPLEEINADTTLRERYRNYASTLHWQRENYQAFLDLFEEFPEDSTSRLRYVLSLVRTGQLDRAVEYRGRLGEEPRVVTANALGNAFYEREEWDRARPFLEAGKPGLEGLFKIGNTYRKQGEPERALDAWGRGLNTARSGEDVERDWLNSMVTGVAQITKQKEFADPASRLLDENWDVLKSSDTIALRGLTGSLRAKRTERAERFVDRLKSVDLTNFVTAAELMEQNENWALLNRWVEKTEDRLGESSFEWGYYRTLAFLETDRLDPISSTRISSWINEAVSAKSEFGPKLQALRGDYHYRNGAPERAAIQYRKVNLLFDDASLSPRGKLRLADSYDQLGEVDKAHSVYSELAESETVPESIRKEARAWLDEHSSS